MSSYRLWREKVSATNNYRLLKNMRSSAAKGAFYMPNHVRTFSITFWHLEYRSVPRNI